MDTSEGGVVRKYNVSETKPEVVEATDEKEHEKEDEERDDRERQVDPNDEQSESREE